MYTVSYQYPSCSQICERKIENKKDAESYAQDLRKIGCKVWIRH